MSDINKFKNLDYDAFRKLASDDSLTQNEKIGFPDHYRKGFEKAILHDIISKTALDHGTNKTVIDIGSGCGDLVYQLIDYCSEKNHRLVLLDSQEMLSQVKTKYKNIEKASGFFPDMPDFLEKNKNTADAVIIYSVMHYVFYHSDLYKFIDHAVSLLKSGGRLILGDIPNASKRKRFFETETGIKFHQQYTNSNTLPDIKAMQSEPAIDDAIFFSILQRYRAMGYETYLSEQSPELPMSNRREDIIICKW